MNGGVVGVAYTSALCVNEFGHGATQADPNTSVVGSALTAAHVGEI